MVASAVVVQAIPNWRAKRWKVFFPAGTLQFLAGSLEESCLPLGKSGNLQAETDWVLEKTDCRPRGTVTVNVLQQLGTAFQTLPGIAMAGYQTEVDSIEADLTALSALINQIMPLLVALDAKAGPLDAKNKKALKTLFGLLQTSAEKSLLDQITGPTSQGGGGTPTPPLPTP